LDPTPAALVASGLRAGSPPFPRRAARTASPRQSPWPSPQPRAHPRGAWNAERDRHAETRLGKVGRLCFGIARGGSRARDFLGSASAPGGQPANDLRQPPKVSIFGFRVILFLASAIQHPLAAIARARRGCQRYPTSTSSGIARQEGLLALDQTANFSFWENFCSP